jgi:hypothetical protein
MWEPEKNMYAPELIQKFCSRGKKDKKPHRSKKKALIHYQIITMSKQDN